MLAADVAGYSRLLGVDEEGTLDRMQALCRELPDPKIAEHRGRIVKTTGDGMLVEFASVVDARCAVAVQRAMPERDIGVAADSRIDWRIGINLGDDLYGDGVNIAARIKALANPGGVLVSNTVHDQVRHRLPLVFGIWASSRSRTSPARCGSTGPGFDLSGGPPPFRGESSPRSPASAGSLSSPAIRLSPIRTKRSM